ncbi:MAG: hypothetical protein ABWY17_23795, partial [Pseudomonas sp.]
SIPKLCGKYIKDAERRHIAHQKNVKAKSAKARHPNLQYGSCHSSAKSCRVISRPDKPASVRSKCYRVSFQGEEHSPSKQAHCPGFNQRAQARRLRTDRVKT